MMYFPEEQRRATRRQIQKAIDMKDPEMLERYILAYERLNPPYDDEVLIKARKTLRALDAKEGNLNRIINPFPNKLWFLRVCSTSYLKTLREKEKLLVTSNFSFSHSVFYLFRDLSAIF